ncbi:trehalose-phosphatase [Anaeromyxobacter oryzae]|uniref:Trehalose 6-phosphate phosphatase n=1 Tax=Anaeromyxobacter oryzae TaxID=2918170 RepID=A0ABM7X3E6_9BACT|nr:trehalose-phosphatase [Anaeromyxobacter oryzae]BDG06304.1 trehalose 6-phosphate phosphatase [Anaeromyxobacter oryzae]
MIPILSPDARGVVDALARDRTMLAFDFDGTLAPYVPRPEDAQLPPATRALLRTTALLYPCAVVSGRARADVAARVSGIPLVAVVGNHGADPGFGPIDRRLADRVAAWIPALRAALASEPGVVLEDKRLSVALHHRAAPFGPIALRHILRATSRLEGARVFAGRDVVNVVPAGAPTKGDAICALCDRQGTRLAVYVGDDRSDEDAFRCDAVRIAIRVGDTPASSARFHLPEQGAVDELLRVLVAARARQDGLGERWEGFVRAVGA